MVKSFVTFYIFLSFLTSEASALEFSMETSLKDFYQGETVTASFVLSGREESVEVEVAKFPEFRSFWSENTVLRQGPLPLLPIGLGFDPSQLLPTINRLQKLHPPSPAVSVPRKAVVGAYIITPMIGREDLQIEPMKIMVRSPFSPNAEPLAIESKMPNLTIRRLPPAPTEVKDRFKGAVGTFRLETENTVLRFRPGEATNLRLVLRGEGNFAEVNQISIDLPSTVETLSNRSQFLPMGTTGAKFFDYTIAIKTREIKALGPFSFTFFSPRESQYRTVSTGTLNLELAEPLETAPTQQETVSLPFYQRWSPSSSYVFSTYSLIFQLFTLLALLAHGIWVHIEKVKRRQHLQPSYIKAQKLKAIGITLQRGDAGTASRDLSLLIEDLLAPPPHSGLCWARSQRLKRAEELLGFEARQTIERYISELDHSRFSREKPPLSNLEFHLQNLEPVLQRLSKLNT